MEKQIKTKDEVIAILKKATQQYRDTWHTIAYRNNHRYTEKQSETLHNMYMWCMALVTALEVAHNMPRQDAYRIYREEMDKEARLIW